MHGVGVQFLTDGRVYEGEFERRLHVFKECSHRLMRSMGSGSWADLFDLIRKLEKTGDLRKAEDLLPEPGWGKE